MQKIHSGKIELILFVIAIVFLYGGLAKEESDIYKFRVFAIDDNGRTQYLDLVDKGKLEEIQESLKNEGYHVYLPEKINVHLARYEMPFFWPGIPFFGTGVSVFELRYLTIEKESFNVLQYRAVMEDFSGKKYYSNWVENKEGLKRREANYIEKGYFNLPLEERTITQLKYTIDIFGAETLEFTMHAPLHYIVTHSWILFKIMILIIFSIILFNFFSARTEIGSAVSKRLPRCIKRIEDNINNLTRKFKDETEKILPWSAVSYGILILAWIFLMTLLFGKFMTLMNVISEVLPYILGAIAAFAILGIIISIVLRITENIKIGDMVEFDNHIGKIKKLGFVYTYIRTPKNERVYIPNIMLSTKTMKRLSRQKAEDEKPYITRFETTLTYKIPLGIVTSLFSLAIRDTADDLEGDFKNERLKKGVECIRSLEDVSEKIEELKKYRKKIEKMIRNTNREEKREKLENKRYILDKRIRELENQKKDWKKYTPFVLVRKLDNYTVNYEFCVFTNHPSQLLKINHYVMKNLKKRFDEFGVEIMSPLQVSKREFNE